MLHGTTSPTKISNTLSSSSKESVTHPSNITDLWTFKREKRDFLTNKEENVQIQLAILEAYYAFFQDNSIHGDLGSSYIRISEEKPYKAYIDVPPSGTPTLYRSELGRKVDRKGLLPMGMMCDIDHLMFTLSSLNDILSPADETNQRVAIGHASHKANLYQTDGGRLAPLCHNVSFAVADEALITLINTLKNELKPSVLETPTTITSPASSISTSASSEASIPSVSLEKDVVSTVPQTFEAKKEALTLFDPKPAVKPVTSKQAGRRFCCGSFSA